MATARVPRQGRAPRSVRQARVMSHRARRQLAPSPDEAVARVAAEVGRAFEAWAQRFVDLVVRDVVRPSRREDQADLSPPAAPIKSLLHEDSTVRQLFEEAGRATPRREVLESAFRMVDKQSADEMRVAGVRTADVVPGLPAKQAAWVRSNTDLIKAESDLRRRVERVIADPLNEGRSVKDIARLLEAQLGYSKSRAELTARDQTLKLHGQIQEERQRAAGIAKYVWTTSQDERVRPDHADLDGTVQAWDDPPIVDQRTGRRGHPGFDFQCRCTAVPVLDEDVETGGAPPPPEPVMTPTQAELDLARRQAESEARRRQLEAEADARIARARAEAERQAREQAAADARARAEAERQAEQVRARNALAVVAPNAVVAAETPVAFERAAATGLKRAGFDRMFAALPAPTVTLRPDVFSGSLGVFNANTNQLVVTTDRALLDRWALKKALPKGRRQLAQMTDIAKTADEVIEITIQHEAGHAVHQTGMRLTSSGPQYLTDVARRVDETIREAFAGAPRITRYGDEPHEWFAEAYAAYHHSDVTKAWLRQRSPGAYETVESVKVLRGIQ